MSTTVFLVRHGSHDLLGRSLCGRIPGVTLSARGEQEAAAAARRLAGQGLSAIYSSPLERTLQTARPIADACELEVEVDEALNELDFGDWSGRAFETLEEEPLWDLWNTDRLSCRPPGGESLQEAQARVVAWMDRVRAERPGQAVAAISHSEIIKAALAHAMGLPLQNHARIEVSPGSVSVVVTGDWGVKAHSMNEVPA